MKSHLTPAALTVRERRALETRSSPEIGYTKRKLKTGQNGAQNRSQATV
jgi:hypothetical protein